MKPKLSVAICTYNRSRQLRKCLKCLTNQTFKNFEVIIIDGGSTDNTNEVINDFAKKLRIGRITFKSDQLSQARDKGWRKASGELVSWIDDDVEVSPNWAKEIINTFDSHKGIAGVSGPTIVKENFVKSRDVFVFYNRKKGIWKILGGIWNYIFLEGKMYEPGLLLKSGAWTPGSNFKECLKIKGIKDVDYLEACNMTLRRDFVKRVGGYDFGYKGIAEWSELDLSIRVKELGYRLIFNPKVKVNHNVSLSGAYKRRPQAKLRMENFYKFYFRHIFKLHPAYVAKFLLYLVFLNTYWTYKALSTKNLKWLGGWIGSLTGLKYAKKKK